MKGWRYVSRGECVKTIIWVLIAACVLFIPAIFSASGVTLTYSTMPVIGDNTFMNLCENAISGFTNMAHLSDGIVSCIRYCFTYGVYFYFSVLIVDIILAVLLIITQLEPLRMFAKIFSVLFGIFMLIIGLVFIIFIVGVIINVAKGGSNMLNVLQSSGIATAAGFVVFGILIGIKQFKWFSKAF